MRPLCLAFLEQLSVRQTPKRKGKAMEKIFPGFRIVGALALLTVAVGCASTQETEDLLLKAGFRTVTVTNPQQQQLRPYKVTVTEQNGKTYYVYTDPARNQNYVGDQSQYQRYRRLKKELEAAQQSYDPPVYGP
jgi:hypothetical protein